MIDSSMWLEKFLQNYRFAKVKPYLSGKVLDFGGNQGELAKLVGQENYLAVNYDRRPMKGRKFDTIVALAVIEHIEYEEVFKIFGEFQEVLNPQGKVFLTTPTTYAKPVLETLARVGFLDKHNIEEHKHYWTKKEIEELAHQNGFRVAKYGKFQGVFNQYAIFEKE
jgi:cyclopropane fatty-acyl-phospholipid synthase-like methyltransferase